MTYRYRRDWRIECNPKPIPTRAFDYDYWHDDYDGAEDSGDHRCGNADSLASCIMAIEEYIAEQEEDDLRRMYAHQDDLEAAAEEHDRHQIEENRK